MENKQKTHCASKIFLKGIDNDIVSAHMLNVPRGAGGQQVD